MEDNIQKHQIMFGNFSVNIPKQDMDKRIWVTQTPQGRIESAREEIRVKGIPASLPIVNEVNSETTQITGKSDNGARIVVKLEDNSTYTSNANSQGNFSVTIPKQDMNKKIRITQKPSNKLESEVVEIQVKGIKALKPTILDVYEGQTKIKGNAERYANVKIILGNNQEYTGQADSNGNYTITVPAQQANQIIYVTQTPNRKMESDRESTIVKYTSVTGNLTIDPVNSGQDIVYGWARPNTQIQISLNDGSMQSIEAEGNGRWSYNIGYNRGNQYIKVRQIQADGTWSSFKYVSITQLEKLPNITIDEIDNNQSILRGKGYPGATVYISGANSGSKYTEVDSNRRLEHRNRRRKSEETKYMVISIIYKADKIVIIHI